VVQRFVVVNAAAALHKFSAKQDHLVQDLLVNFLSPAWLRTSLHQMLKTK
jgi:hypothetical protein